LKIVDFRIKTIQLGWKEVSWGSTEVIRGQQRSFGSSEVIFEEVLYMKVCK
jgi:hypothetical protein